MDARALDARAEVARGHVVRGDAARDDAVRNDVVRVDAVRERVELIRSLNSTRHRVVLVPTPISEALGILRQAAPVGTRAVRAKTSLALIGRELRE